MRTPAPAPLEQVAQLIVLLGGGPMRARKADIKRAGTPAAPLDELTEMTMTKRIKAADLPEFGAAPYLDSETAVAAYLTDILEANDPGLARGGSGRPCPRAGHERDRQGLRGAGGAAAGAGGSCLRLPCRRHSAVQAGEKALPPLNAGLRPRVPEHERWSK